MTQARYTYVVLTMFGEQTYVAHETFRAAWAYATRPDIAPFVDYVR